MDRAAEEGQPTFKAVRQAVFGPDEDTPPEQATRHDDAPIGSVRVPTPTKRTETKVQVKAPPAVVNLPAGVPDLSRAKEVPPIPRDRSITTAELLTKNLAAIARYMDKGRDKQTIERFEIILSSRDQLTTGTLKDAAVTCRRVGQRFFDMADRLYEGATSTRRGPVANPH